eukprot:359161-Chlamydomonas_euryale.AAC.3
MGVPKQSRGISRIPGLCGLRVLKEKTAKECSRVMPSLSMREECPLVPLTDTSHGHLSRTPLMSTSHGHLS